MSNAPNNFVISLKSATTRREHIRQMFADSNVDFAFFDAIEPTANFTQAFNLKLDMEASLLEKTELACLLSHVSLWQYAIEQDMDYIGIFEDDIYFGKNADFFLNNYDWIPTGVHLIKLEAFKVYRPMRQNKISVANNRKIAILKERHLGGAGYILSKSIAMDLIDYVQSQTQLPPLDYILFDPYFIHQLKHHYDIYQLQPALCVQDMNRNKFTHSLVNEDQNQQTLTSQLEADRIKSDKSVNKMLYTEDKTLITKIKREVHKLFFRNQDKIRWR